MAFLCGIHLAWSSATCTHKVSLTHLSSFSLPLWLRPFNNIACSGTGMYVLPSLSYCLLPPYEPSRTQSFIQAYGNKGAFKFFGILFVFLLNVLYKYQVHGGRRGGMTFFQHGMDYFVFGPITIIIVVTMIKVVTARTRWDSGMPLFKVRQVGPDALTISSGVGTIELTHAVR